MFLMTTKQPRAYCHCRPTGLEECRLIIATANGWQLAAGDTWLVLRDRPLAQWMGILCALYATVWFI